MAGRISGFFFRPNHLPLCSNPSFRIGLELQVDELSALYSLVYGFAGT